MKNVHISVTMCLLTLCMGACDEMAALQYEANSGTFRASQTEFLTNIEPCQAYEQWCGASNESCIENCPNDGEALIVCLHECGMNHGECDGTCPEEGEALVMCLQNLGICQTSPWDPCQQEWHAFAACKYRGVCGNGVLEAGEECDHGSQTLDHLDCVSGCKAAKCGDGHVRLWDEQCDDGNNVDGDGCSAGCEIESSPLPQ